MSRLERLQLGQNLVQIVRRAGDHRLRSVAQHQNGKAVTRVGPADVPFDLFDRLLKPSPNVTGCGHAQRRVEYDNMVSSRGVRHRFEPARFDPLPTPFGPVGRGAHGRQRQQQCQHPQGQEQPAVDPTTVPLLGRHQEADRRPRDDLIPLPRQEVNENRYTGGDRECAQCHERQRERGEEHGWYIHGDDTVAIEGS